MYTGFRGVVRSRERERETVIDDSTRVSVCIDRLRLLLDNGVLAVLRPLEVIEVVSENPGLSESAERSTSE